MSALASSPLPPPPLSPSLPWPCPPAQRMSRSDDETRQPLLSSTQPVYSGVDGSGPPSPQGEAQQVEQRPAHRLRDGPVTPLPKLQMTALCIMRLSERECDEEEGARASTNRAADGCPAPSSSAIAFLGILPFVAKMLQENMPDVPKQQIGCEWNQ